MKVVSISQQKKTGNLQARVTPRLQRQNQSRLPGAFVVSLDFELHWGVRDILPLNQSEKNKLLAARAGIPRLLDLFEEFSIHATWATVGLLFARSREEAEAFRPAKLPYYTNPRLYPYREPTGNDEADDPFHFAPSLIAQIAARRDQEIACHSFSHFYCMESGQGQEEFESDLNSAVAIAANSGYILRSYIFPRNQVHQNYLVSLKKAGVWAYRENEQVNVKQSAAFSEQRHPMKRIGRLLDSFIDLYGNQTVAWPTGSVPVSVPASRYLRPYHAAFGPFESLLLRRIDEAMKHAAEQGEVFHLWWHPEDFASDYDHNLRTLRCVLKAFDHYRTQFGMVSLSMAEVSKAQQIAPTAPMDQHDARHVTSA